MSTAGTSLWDAVTASSGDLSAGTLLELRKELVRRSGDYSLVADAENGDWTDTGANGRINDALRWLDDRFQYPAKDAWLYKPLAAGEAFVTFNHARVIKEVWVTDPTNGERFILEERAWGTLRDRYDDIPLSGVSQGEPSYWCKQPIRLAPSQHNETDATLEAAGIEDRDFLVYGHSQYPVKGVIVLPPTDVARTIQILCEWWSPRLISDYDLNWWTVERPDLVIRVAMKQMEIDNRNSAGHNDFMGPILDEVQHIYHGMIAEEMTGEPKRWRMNG